MAFGNITVIGSLNIDHIFFVDRLPLLGESYEAKEYKKALGGKGANAAIAAYRSCHTNSDSAESGEKLDTHIHVRMVGAVGNDGDGKWMLDELEAAKVDVTGVRIETKMTGMTFIIVEEPVEGSDEGSEEKLTIDNRLIYTIGANATLQPEHFANVAGLSNDTRPDLIISQLEIALGTVETILTTAHTAGIKVLLNAAPANVIERKFYPYITHLLVNEPEAAMLFGCFLEEVTKEKWTEMAEHFLDAGVENFVITLGAKGAFYASFQPHSTGVVEAFHVDKVVDPTGAGDTFTGVYAAEYVRQQKEHTWDLEKAVRRACAAGALTVAKAGAQAGIPWADEIDGLLDSPSAKGEVEVQV